MTEQWFVSKLSPGKDAYGDWNKGDGKDFHPVRSTWQHAILELAGDKTVNELFEYLGFPGFSIQSSQPLPTDPDVPLAIAPWWLNNDKGLLAGAKSFPLLVHDSFLKILEEDGELAHFISRVLIGAPLGGSNGANNIPCSTPVFQPSGPAPGTKKRVKKSAKQHKPQVVIGVIDDAIAFGHERFRNKNGGTRVEYTWVQDGTCCDQDGSCCPGQSPVPYGREFDKGVIDGFLDQSTAHGNVDEDHFYRLTGQGDFGREGRKTVTFRRGHGTHILDLVAGEDPTDYQDDCPIVCVQLPERVTADSSGALMTPTVGDAVGYILDRAGRIADEQGLCSLPVVINFSYGLFGGPHDGRGLLERELDRLIRQRRISQDGGPTDIVIPSGNGHLARAHAVVQFANSSTVQTIKWRVLPDDKTSNFVEIWLPVRTAGSGGSRLSLKVTSPWGGAGSAITDKESGKALVWRPGGEDGQVLCKISYEELPAWEGRGRFVVALTPSNFEGPVRPLSPSGDWLIELENIALNPEVLVEAWIQRDDTIPGYLQRGRQSYFVNEPYQRFDPVSGRIEENDQDDSLVKRAGMMSAIATGSETVVVGALIEKELVQSEYTAGGPAQADNLNWANKTGPDALVVSDESRVHRGVLAAGTRSGSRVTLSGTSVAAPQAARYIADRRLCGENDKTGREIIEEKAKCDEQKIASHAPGRPDTNERFGHGRIWSLERAAPRRVGSQPATTGCQPPYAKSDKE